jgi:hypothetical protein
MLRTTSKPQTYECSESSEVPGTVLLKGVSVIFILPAVPPEGIAGTWNLASLSAYINYLNTLFILPENISILRTFDCCTALY